MAPLLQWQLFLGLRMRQNDPPATAIQGVSFRGWQESGSNPSSTYSGALCLGHVVDDNADPWPFIWRSLGLLCTNLYTLLCQARYRQPLGAALHSVRAFPFRRDQRRDGGETVPLTKAGCRLFCLLQARASLKLTKKILFDSGSCHLTQLNPSGTI